MERWILIVESNCCDPSKEKEFNDWYDNVHLADILETPGMLRATRYKNDSPAEGRGKFLALYEIEAEDIDQTMASFGDNVSRKWEQGRISELIVPLSATMYRQITAPVETK